MWRAKVRIVRSLHPFQHRDVIATKRLEQRGWTLRATAAVAFFVLVVTLTPSSSVFAGLVLTQLGSDIEGSTDEFLGKGVALSSNGSRLVVGAPANPVTSPAVDQGFVRVFDWGGSSWSQVGVDIPGESVGDHFGHSVAISDDGSRIAVGARRADGVNGSDSGHVRVFDWNGSAWVQVGGDIDGEAAADWFGTVVSLSADGSRLAASAPSNDGTASSAGHARVFDWDGTNWTQVGADIDGAQLGGALEGLALSSDGSRVAVGEYNYDNGGISNAGRVRVFELVGSSWTQRGGDISGSIANTGVGISLSLSSSGSRLAVGSNLSGVAVFDWNPSTSDWDLVGLPIPDEAAGDQARAVSLSSSGSRLAIGAPFNDGNGNAAGHLRVFDWDGSSWNQVGSDQDGEAAGDYFGYSASLADDGSRVAAGGPRNGGGGLIAGNARVFSIATASSDSSLSGVVLNSGTLSPAFASGTTSYAVSVANGVSSITVTPTTSDAGASVTVDGAAVSSGVASSAIALSVGSNTISIVVTAADSSTSTYTLTVTRAAPTSSGRASDGSSGSSSRSTTVVGAEVPPVVPRRAVEPPNPQPDIAPVSGPVDFDRAEGGVRALVGGVEAPLRVTEGGPDKWAIDVGGFGVEVDAPERDSGGTGSAGGSEQRALEVPRGQVAALKGGGALPGSLVQVWLTGSRGEAREIARVRVGADGQYGYQLNPDAGNADRATPIGRRTLQVVGVNESGLQTVVDIPVVIAQGVPIPERNLLTGELPHLSAGHSLGTSGGIPETISIVGFPEEGVVAVQGAQWSFTVKTDLQSGSVENVTDSTILRLGRGAIAHATGSGFVPGTVATVWLFSDPTMMASVIVGDDGVFSSEFLVDASAIPRGEHTLQMQGVGTDGYIKAANLGVLVEEPVELTTESASGLLWWVVGVFLVSLVMVLLVLARRRRREA